MFTGLVEEIGKVQRLERRRLGGILAIRARKVLDDLAVGDSVAVNGVCLTVTSCDQEAFTAEVMAETLSRTNLGALEAGSKVNLERALALGGRLGGHLVTGHVDGVGTVVDRRPEGDSVWVWVEAPLELAPYLVGKGSVALDGVSLTVVERRNSVFSVSLVGHTLSHTTLGEKTVGAKVNLEIDLIARYLAGLLGLEARREPGQEGINLDLLTRYGFV
ncbi:MAG: riboflavin synthase [Clostridia bacterium]|nr:riboflavin synthase [Clostridia bacterium]MDH7573910.1 riboflavin synthase [Clostridia bacterium]